MWTLSTIERASARVQLLSSERVPTPIMKKIAPRGTIQNSEIVGNAWFWFDPLCGDSWQ